MIPVSHCVLWRHADAGEPLDDAEADFDRMLSGKGRRQAADTAAWLRGLELPTPVLLASPAPRARRTARAFGVPMIDPRLAPEAHLAQAMELLAGAQAPALILVGHQPVLGQLAARLLTGASTPFVSVGMRKGAAWWFVRKADGRAQLHAVHNVLR